MNKTHFSKVLKSNLKEVEKIEVYSLDNPNEIWQIGKPLFMIEQGGMGIVLDYKLMNNLARIFNEILVDRIGKEVHNKLSVTNQHFKENE